MKAAALVVLALMFPSCASIVSDSTYRVLIDTAPSGGDLMVTNRSHHLVFQGKAPVTLSLEAGSGFFRAEKYRIVATSGGKTTTETLNAEIDPWYFGNLLFGGVLGFLIVDPATGAMWKLRRYCHVGGWEPTISNPSRDAPVPFDPEKPNYQKMKQRPHPRVGR